MHSSEVRTCNGLHALCIAKVGIWGMHLAQVQRQVESASVTVTPMPHHASHMPEYGAQQIIGRHVMRSSHCRVVEPILQALRMCVYPHLLLVNRSCSWAFNAADTCTGHPAIAADKRMPMQTLGPCMPTPQAPRKVTQATLHSSRKHVHCCIEHVGSDIA